MPDYTSRLALAKPRGGSSGSTPADPVDIDVLNGNADKIDNFIAAPSCTSTARPTGVFDGQLAYETNTKNLIRYNTTTSQWEVLGGVVTFTQASTGTTGWSQTYAYYSKSGNIVTVWGSFTAASTGSPALTDLQLTLPVGARTANYGGANPAGIATFVDVSANARYMGFVYLLSATIARVASIGTNGVTSAGLPFAVGTSDQVFWQFSYIAAD